LPKSLQKSPKPFFVKMKVDGTYCLVRTQEQCDWLAEWYGDEAKGMVGVKTTMHIKELPGKKVACAIMVDGHPQYNSMTLTSEDVDNCVDSPFFGGKAKVKYTKTAKGYTSVVTTENMGVWEYDEEYCEQGIKIVVKKDGKCMNENWVRVIEENGFYVTTKTTNVEKFLKETGTPAEMIDTMGDYKMCWKSCGDTIKMVEWFGETEVTFTSKLDEENDYVWPVAGVPPSKYCVTRTGNGKYTSMVKDEAGNESEWNFQFCGEGAKICGRNLKTGTTCSFEMTKELPMFGKFKSISQSGAKENMMLLGVPEAMANELASGEIRMEFQHKGPMVRYQYHTKTQNLDIMFKWDEEVCFVDPVVNETCHMVATKTGGNCVKVVTKMPNATIVANCTFNPNFVVEKCHIDGLDCMPWTVIYKRC